MPSTCACGVLITMASYSPASAVEARSTMSWPWASSSALKRFSWPNQPTTMRGAGIGFRYPFDAFSQPRTIQQLKLFLRAEHRSGDGCGVVHHLLSLHAWQRSYLSRLHQCPNEQTET